MILIVTNREDVTADFVVLELKERKKKFIRFNTEDFPEKVATKVSCVGKRFLGYFNFKPSLPFSAIKSIWYRRPLLPCFSKIPKEYRDFCKRETLFTLNGIWNNLNCFWVSNPTSIHLAENKLTQLKLATDIGFLIPSTIISNNYPEIKKFWENHKGNIIIKPIKAGILNDREVVFTSKVKLENLKHLQRSLPLPSIYQKNIEKVLDLRINVIGKKLFSTAIYSQKNKDSVVDWRKAQDINLPHEKYELPPYIKSKCFDLVKSLGLEFGAIDMIYAKDGKYYFLEINPNGQWAWIEKRTGVKLTAALTDLLIRGRS